MDTINKEQYQALMQWVRSARRRPDQSDKWYLQGITGLREEQIDAWWNEMGEVFNADRGINYSLALRNCERY
jgi:hypothetical protein